MRITSIEFSNNELYFNLENLDSINYQELILRIKDGKEFFI